jgi:hypothetical protein
MGTEETLATAGMEEILGTAEMVRIHRSLAVVLIIVVFAYVQNVLTAVQVYLRNSIQ